MLCMARVHAMVQIDKMNGSRNRVRHRVRRSSHAEWVLGPYKDR